MKIVLPYCLDVWRFFLFLVVRHSLLVAEVDDQGKDEAHYRDYVEECLSAAKRAFDADEAPESGVVGLDDEKAANDSSQRLHSGL